MEIYLLKWNDEADGPQSVVSANFKTLRFLYNQLKKLTYCYAFHIYCDGREIGFYGPAYDAER